MMKRPEPDHEDMSKLEEMRSTNPLIDNQALFCLGCFEVRHEELVAAGVTTKCVDIHPTSMVLEALLEFARSGPKIVISPRENPPAILKYDWQHGDVSLIDRFFSQEHMIQSITTALQQSPSLHTTAHSALAKQAKKNGAKQQEMMKRLLTSSYFMPTLDLLPTQADGMFTHWMAVTQYLRALFPDMVFVASDGHGKGQVMAFFNLQGAKGTALHLDSTPAVNAAFALYAADVHQVLAHWVCISPEPGALSLISAFLHNKASKHLKSKFLNFFEIPPLLDGKGTFIKGGDGDVIKALGYEFEKLDLEAASELEAAFPTYIKVLRQFHGDTVVLQSGWLHSVINSGIPNVKIAFDHIREKDLSAIALMHRLFACNMVSQRSAEDYTSTPLSVYYDVDFILNSAVREDGL